MSEQKTTLRAFERGNAGGNGEWRLRVTDGGARGREFVLGPMLAARGGAVVLGKADDADIGLTDSGVSRHHAKIMATSDGLLMLIDLDSTNGTFVNEARVEVCALRPGQRIRLGPDVELEVEFRVPADREIGDATEAEPFRLTPRELEVARLVARGSSNPDIARALGVKVRTVATHLENIYRRLEISSRAELARRLAEAGLA